MVEDQKKPVDDKEIIDNFEKYEKFFAENQMNREQAEAYLNQLPKIPENYKNFIGLENIMDLNELFLDPALKEIDMTILMGDLKYREAARYMQVLQEYYDFSERLNIIAENIISLRIEKLRVNLKEKLGVVKYIAAFLKDLQAIYEFLRLYFKTPKVLPVFRNDLLKRFQSLLVSKFSLALLKKFSQASNCSIKQAADYYLKYFKQHLIDKFPENEIINVLFLPIRLLHVITYLIDKNRQDLDSAFKNEPEASDDELNVLFNEIIKESYFKKISDSESKFKNYTIKLGELRETDLQIHLARTLLFAGVHLTPDKDSDRMLVFTVNRLSGEIVVDAGYIPLSEFIDQKTYKKIKKKIYELLLEMFKNKEADLPEIIPEKITSGVNKKVDEVLEEKKESEPVWKYVPFKPEEKNAEGSTECSAEASPAPIEQETEAEEEKRIYFDKLTGLSGNEVLSKLTRLLGDPVKITGSHHFFQRLKGKGIFPISLHGKKEVGIGMLKKCLNEYAITAMEFAEA